MLSKSPREEMLYCFLHVEVVMWLKNHENRFMKILVGHLKEFNQWRSLINFKVENKVTDLEFWMLRWWKVWDGETLKRPQNYTFRDDDSLNSDLSCRHGGDKNDPENWKYDWPDLMVVLVRSLQRNRANMIYVESIRRRFIMEIGSHDYGDQEVPWSAICRLEPQESQWDNWAWVWRCENLRSVVWALVWVWKPWYPVSEGRRCWVSLLKRINSSSEFSVLFRTPVTRTILPSWGRVVFFTQSMTQMLIFSRFIHTNTLRNKVCQLSELLLLQSRLT